jgi:hypothetical protein
MGRLVYIRNKKTKAFDPKTGKGERGTWPESYRMKALTTFLATGSQAHTAAITGIPEQTIASWRKQEWWNERIKEIREGENIQLDAKLTKVMDKALDAVVDRIENGEYMYDPRTGEIRRVPAKLRDVQKVAGDMIDKKTLLAKVQKGKEEQKQAITADHLVMLAREFSKFATGKEHKDVDDVKTVIDGEHEEVFEQLGQEVTEVASSDSFKEEKSV